LIVNKLELGAVWNFLNCVAHPMAQLDATSVIRYQAHTGHADSYAHPLAVTVHGGSLEALTTIQSITSYRALWS
jgi:predicted NAD/FAD-binding protein